MDRVKCTKCGQEHDLSEIEPRYHRPDAYFELPEAEREDRALFGSDDGRIRDATDSARRHFLRVLLPVRVRGDNDVCWGVWVEVSASAWKRAHDLWEDADQANEPPFEATLANELKGYEGTLGLTGRVQLTGPTTAPRFQLDLTQTHALVEEQRDGVFPERALEWAMAHVH